MLVACFEVAPRPDGETRTKRRHRENRARIPCFVVT
jgi:hypothetical protein